MGKCSDCFFHNRESGEFPCNECERFDKFVSAERFKDEVCYPRDSGWIEGVSGVSDKDFDHVNKPQHYTKGNFEVIDVIEDWDLNFRLANTVKYIARHKHKGKPLEDLKKAMWYLQREIDKHDPRVNT